MAKSAASASRPRPEQPATIAEYRERAPRAELAFAVACVWRGCIGNTGVPYTDRVLPDACVDLIWDGSCLFVAGPDTQAVPFEPRANETFVGLRMHPGCAPLLLGRPACEVLDQRVGLDDLWPLHRVRALLDAAAAAPDVHEIAAAFERELCTRLAETAGVDPTVGKLVSLFGAAVPDGPGLVARLAAELGVTERSLHRRCVDAVGYGPKTLHRVLRFQRARALARRGAAPGLGELALAAGYSDQAHLTRECRRLSGLTPSELFKTRPRDATIVPA